MENGRRFVCQFVLIDAKTPFLGLQINFGDLQTRFVSLQT